MSDFLGNFTDKAYKDMDKVKHNERKKKQSSANQPVVKKKRKRKRKESTAHIEREPIDSCFDDAFLIDDTDVDNVTLNNSIPLLSTDKEEVEEPVKNELHDVEIDPNYVKKQQQKKLMLIGGALLSLIVIYVIYYQVTRVKMPNFTDKSITDVRKWANETNMEAEYKTAFSLDKDSNDVIKQSIKSGENVKKGSTITFTISEGPDPEETLKLPDFKVMSQPETEEWVSKNKAENLNVLMEYNDKLDKGKFIRIEFGNKDVTADTYKRRDLGNVYYSKGKEIFEKNIAVPDFTGKQKNDVAEWGTKNDIAITFEEADSDKVEEGLVLSQSQAKNSKVAKKDKLTVTLSLGKAAVVPNFSNYSAENAASSSDGLEVTVQQVFSDSVAYGKLMSQSIPAGTKLTGKDSKSIQVVYSTGRPYIKSYYGQLEGDIPKFIYDDFNSKGASMTFEIYYIDSDKEKGEIVKMNVYNQYIPMTSHLVFGISNGRYADAPTARSSADMNNDSD